MVAIHDDTISSHLESLSLSESASESPSLSIGMEDTTPTLYVPIASPPTPAPSPRPLSFFAQSPSGPAHISRLEFASLKSAGTIVRQQYLASILADCTPAELLFISATISPLLKRDFLRELPLELALSILSFIDDPRSLAHASCVSRRWRVLATDENTWKQLCQSYGFKKYPERSAGMGEPEYAKVWAKPDYVPSAWQSEVAHSNAPSRVASPALDELARKILTPLVDNPFSYREHFIRQYKTMMNWKRKGRLLSKHRPPATSPDGGVVTSVAIDHEWIVVGLASCRIQVFSARTGVLSRTLVGHESGVWAVNLVSSGGYLSEPPEAISNAPVATGGGLSGPSEVASVPKDRIDVDEMDYHIPGTLRVAIGLDKPKVPVTGLFNIASFSKPYIPKPSDACCTTEGWGNANALVISGGCDKSLRVWDVKSGYCIYVLQGHTSTIRCLRVLHNRPIAVTGSRDNTLRVWDVQRGKSLRVLSGHRESVRCLDVFGNQAVSGSYDCTCRLWNIDTGECLQVLAGHAHQIYSVVYDGRYIASGGLDTTVRIWNPITGECLALLQGHSALVCQLQVYGDILATGGSDGRVITYSLESMSAMRRVAAHDSSVTALQIDAQFLVTGGNDGRVRLFDAVSGNYVRDLTEPAEAVWKVAHKYDKCVVLCKRGNKTVMEIWSFRPSEQDD